MHRAERLGAGLLALCALLPAVARAADRCEYRNVYVEPDNAVVDGYLADALEPLRGFVRDLAAGAAAGAGLTVVEDRDDAWLRLQVSAFASSVGDPYLQLDLTPYLKLQHHLFVAVLSEPGFPASRIGASYGMELAGPPPDAEIARRVRVALDWIGRTARPELDALCALRARLVDEGWSEIEELRKQLVIEMRDARAQRRRETQRKQLEIEAE